MSSGELALQLVVYVGFIALLVAVPLRRRFRKKPLRPVSDGPSDEPYRIYTREFDLELHGRDVEQRLISASPDYVHGWLKLGKDRWRRDVQLADQLYEEHRESFQRILAAEADLSDCAVTFLVDQSGSMEGHPMRWAAVSCRLAAEALQGKSCQLEILGFSTAGWRGGFAREKWLNSKRPKRPGRLRALLHLVYKDFGESELEKADWEAMLNPNVLRENIDGEALLWAADRLRHSQAPSRHLVILSDGAPIDDATLMHNGLGYLARHLRLVISELEADSSISLSAIGLRHAVDQYYGRSVTVDDLSELPEVTAKWLIQLNQSAAP